MKKGSVSPLQLHYQITCAKEMYAESEVFNQPLTKISQLRTVITEWHKPIKFGELAVDESGMTLFLVQSGKAGAMLDNDSKLNGQWQRPQGGAGDAKILKVAVVIASEIKSSGQSGGVGAIYIIRADQRSLPAATY
jgi:hypothetical protein